MVREEKLIKLIQFGILSPDEILKLSVVQVDSDMTFEHNLPKLGGLLDQRMGTVDKEFFCTTDMGSFLESPGYFGHISLNRPVFHEGFMDYVLRILRCIDHTTSKLIINENSQKIKNVLKIKNLSQRLNIISKLCLTACNLKKNKFNNFLKDEIIEKRISIQPKYSRDGWCIVAKFDSRITSEPTRLVSAERIHEIFVKITDEACEKLGLNPKLSRPDWMIITVLPVPPPTIRPSVKFETLLRAEDDLTYKLGDIIRTNKILRKAIFSCLPSQLINEQINLLQYHIGSYMNNSVPSLAKSLQKSGRPIKSIKQRLQGKEGRLRGNLMGKRVDFSARTVITPDPNIKLDELGVPLSIAMNLTFPEIVTSFNIEYMKFLLYNGPYKHPGAKYLIRNDNNRIDLRYVKNLSNINLENGYCVERHLQNGDLVLFNRQPSLHKMSMMGHIVKVMKFSTFRLNLSATSPYNADFDGDEMNLHFPQNVESKSELKNLLMVSNCIVSPQGNKPIMGIVQDSLLGSMLITEKGNFLSKYEIMAYLNLIEGYSLNIPLPAIYKPRILWTGKQLISTIIPCINLSRTCISHPEHEKAYVTSGDTRVIIFQGQLLSGMIDKRTIGATSGGLIHVIWKDIGPSACSYFISNFQIIVNNWLQLNGFSVGIGDCIPTKMVKKDVSLIIKTAKLFVKKSIKRLLSKKFNGFFNKDSNYNLENHLNKVLNNARDMAGSSAQKCLSSNNNLKKMIFSGSKGSLINISQIVACVGQQNVEGKRIPFGFRKRSLPHYHYKNFEPETRGFVVNSYIEGLFPDEFFFHSMGGREGLIDTAIKTSETGYIQRRLSKSMEDIVVEYDFSVRNNQQEIISFLYGEDCFDAVYLENQKIFLGKMSDIEMNMVYKVTQSSPCFGLAIDSSLLFLSNKSYNSKIANIEYNQLLKDREFLRKLMLDQNDINIPLPVNLDRIVSKASVLFKNHKNSSLINFKETIRSLKFLRNYFLELINFKISFNQKKSDNKQLINRDNFLLAIYIRSSLSLKIIYTKFNLNQHALNWIVNEICLSIRKSLIQPGEMVGTISAQSIGQPATQMTLNTFHFAGVSAKNVTLGVPRLKEIIDIQKNIKSPSLTIFLHKKCSNDPRKVKKIQESIESVRLNRISNYFEIIYDPDFFFSISKCNRILVKNYMEIPDEDINFLQASSWILKLKLLTEEFVEKGLFSNYIIETIKKKIKPIPFLIIASDENSGSIEFLVRFIWPEFINNYNSEKIEKLFSRSNANTFFEYIKRANQKVSENLFLEPNYFKKIKHYFYNYNLKPYGSQKLTKLYPRRIDIIEPEPNQSGKLKNNFEFVLETEGVDLRFVMNYNGIDYSRCTTNDLLESLKVLGIEATRKILIQELRNLISFDGSYVNYRHLCTLVDLITFRGSLMSINRHGINKCNSGPIAKSTFEETVDIFYESAVFGLNDNLRGVSAQIMTGMVPKIGTGKIDLFVNI
mmetsp:Transcript_26273/g.86336  ORF Transcript_26273/g.86336 Transcript_26273/m.86336 type:complete len:1474 (-) Transcript_26273:1121-5542(-)